MKIKFPDTLTGNVTQEPLRAVNPQRAPLHLLADLQMETGWTMKEFQERGRSFYGHAMSIWLTLHNAGFTITWDEAQNLSLDDIELIEEPGDRAAAGLEENPAEGDASEPASPASNQEGASNAPPKAVTRSKKKSPGSTAKSAKDSPTS